MRFALILVLTSVLPCCGRGPAPHEPVPVAEINAAFASTEKARIDRMIERLRPDAPAYMQVLIANLSDTDRWVRECSAHAIGEFAYQDDAVIDALITSFDDEDDYVRWKAVRALGRIGPMARRALPLIEVAANASAKDEVEVVRAAAKVAVASIKGE